VTRIRAERTGVQILAAPSDFSHLQDRPDWHWGWGSPAAYSVGIGVVSLE